MTKKKGANSAKCVLCGMTKPGSNTWLEYGRKRQICKSCLKLKGMKQLANV